MLSKTRTTIITLVATFSVGGAAMVPTVAQARAKKPGVSHKKLCADLKKQMGFFIELAVSHMEKGEEVAAETDDEIATEIVKEAKAAGCSWAVRVTPNEGIHPEGTPPVSKEEPAPKPPSEGIHPIGPPPPAV